MNQINGDQSILVKPGGVGGSIFVVVEGEETLWPSVSPEKSCTT